MYHICFRVVLKFFLDVPCIIYEKGKVPHTLPEKSDALLLAERVKGEVLDKYLFGNHYLDRDHCTWRTVCGKKIDLRRAGIKSKNNQKIEYI